MFVSALNGFEVAARELMREAKKGLLLLNKRLVALLMPLVFILKY